MHFLPDVYVTCETCKGKRYNRETLEVTFKGKNIAEVLDMTIREALDYLHHQEQKHRAGLIRHDEHFIACARLGANDAIIAYGTKEQLARIDFGEAPYCLILPGQLHFLEEEFLEQYRI